MSRRRLAWAGAWVVGTGLLLTLGREVEWGLLVRRLGEVDLAWVVLAVLSNLAILPLWASQWRGFLPRGSPVSFGRMLEINALTSAALNTVPFVAGQASGVLLVARRARAGMPAALSVLALDQAAEGLAKVTVVGLAALTLPLPPWLTAAARALLGAVLLLLVLLLVAALLLGRGGMAVAEPGRVPGAEAGDGPSPPGAARGWIRHLRRWAGSLEPLRSPLRAGAGYLWALAMKGAELGAILGVQAAFGLPPDPAGGVFVLATVSLATIVSVSPGNLGVYEGAVFLAYRHLGLAPEVALGLAAVQHAAFLAPMVGPGWGVLLFRSLAGGPAGRSVSAPDPLPRPPRPA